MGMETVNPSVSPADSAVVTFYRGIPQAPLPVRADSSALGTLPVAAYRHCSAVTAASGHGWYVFSPLEFSLVWDGADMLWTHGSDDVWYPLSSAQFPGFADYWIESAPADLREYAPPFLANTAQPGIIQLWTGLFVKSRPGWSIMVRSPVNLQRSLTTMFYEGIIETDQWFGPLFINIRILRTDFPIVFGTEQPLFQVQPIPRIAYSEATRQSFQVVGDPLAFTSADWAAYKAVVEGSSTHLHRSGRYAASVRKREKSGND